MTTAHKSIALSWHTIVIEILVAWVTNGSLCLFTQPLFWVEPMLLDKPSNFLQFANAIILSTSANITAVTEPCIMKFHDKMPVARGMIFLIGQLLHLRIIMKRYSNSSTVTLFHIKEKHRSLKNMTILCMFLLSIGQHGPYHGIRVWWTLLYHSNHFLVAILFEMFLLLVDISGNGCRKGIWLHNHTQV